MRLVFNLKNPDGTDRTGLQLTPEIYRKINNSYTNIITLNAQIVELGYGDYELSFNEPDSYDYLRVYALFENTIVKRFTVYPELLRDTSSSDIARAVWEYSGGERAITSARLSTNVTLPTNQTIGALIWEHEQGNGRRLTNARLGSSNVQVTAETPYLCTTKNVADIVWDRPEGTTRRELSNYKFSDIADAVWTRTFRTVTSIDTLAIANTVWGRIGEDTTSRTITQAFPDINALATKTDITDAVDALKLWGGEHWVTATGFLTAADLPTSESIATEVWGSDNVEAIVTAVLTTDITPMEVVENAYTLKHLIMASQRSRVVTGNGGATLWEIRDGDEEGTVIATRQLTLNGNGAIESTDKPDESADEPEIPTE